MMIHQLNCMSKLKLNGICNAEMHLLKYNRRFNRIIGYLKIVWTQKINSPIVMVMHRIMMIVGYHKLKLLHQVDHIVVSGWGHNSFLKHTIHRAGNFNFLCAQKKKNVHKNKTKILQFRLVLHFSILIAKPLKLASIFQLIVRLVRIQCQCHQLHLDAELFPYLLNPDQPVCALQFIHAHLFLMLTISI